MEKDCYWFRHDASASYDPKIQLLEQEFGNDGYAVYFKTLELLRMAENFEVNQEVIAAMWKFYNVDIIKLSSILKHCIKIGLFQITENKCLYSEAFSRRMFRYMRIRESLSRAGKKGMEIRWSNNTRIRSDNEKSRVERNRVDIFNHAQIQHLLMQWTEEQKAALQTWLTYKNEKRQSYKLIGLKTLINRWTPIKERFMSAVNYSMQANYSGLFEENKNDQRRINQPDDAGKRAISEFLNQP